MYDVIAMSVLFLFLQWIGLGFVKISLTSFNKFYQVLVIYDMHNKSQVWNMFGIER